MAISHGNFAFIGLPKPRYERFEGLALDEVMSLITHDPLEDADISG